MSVHRETMQAAFLDAAQVLRGPLPEVVSMEPILEGAPFAHERTVFDGADGFFAIWACDAGVFPRVKDKRGSFMYIISGDATIVDEDGTSHELTADSVLLLPFGWVGTWHIRETIRKVYLHTTPVPPLPTAVVASVFRPADRVLADLLPSAAAAPGSPIDTDAVIFDGPDGRCDIRSRAPGQYPWAPDHHGFFAFVLAGDGSLVDDDGTRHEFSPGGVIALPGSWSGTWDIRRPLRAFCVRSTPAPQA
ncbi:MAG: cupin domain-containing protein [Streptosporangiaceae bacterium]